MGFFKKLRKAVSRGVGGIVKKAIKGVKKAANFVKKKWGEFSTEMGPLGTLALIVAMPYLTEWAVSTYSTWGAATAAEAAAVEGLAASAATAGTSASISAGTMGISEGITAAATAGEAAALTATPQFLTAATNVATPSILEASLADLAASQTPQFLAAAESATALSGTTTALLDPAALNTATLPVAEGVGFGDLAKAGLKSLLGGLPQEAGFLPTTVAPPALSPSEAVKSLSAGTGGGLGISKFTEEAQPGLVAAARAAEQRYKSLLSRGIR